MRAWSLIGLMPVAVLSLAACGEGIGPVETATLEAVLLDDPSTATASGAPFGSARFAHHKSFGSNYYHGQLAGRVQVLASEDGFSFVALGSPLSVSVALQDTDVRSMLQPGVEVPVGTYRILRLVIDGGQARIDAGGQIGGTELPSDVVLQVGEGAPVVVDVELASPLELSPGQRVRFVLDLNSESWVVEDNVLDGRVRAADVARALRVAVRDAGVLFFTSV
ncbi:MAG: hypothetical protein ACE5HP_08200 [Gemmatimonadota bacterium]